MESRVKVFISQPMNGKSDEEILQERINAVDKIKELTGKEVEILDSFHSDYDLDHGCIPLKYLAKSLVILADADVIYFCRDWEKYRGCKIEHLCAIDYSVGKVMYGC